MGLFWGIVAFIVYLSYRSSANRGVPWFSWGGTRKRPQRKRTAMETPCLWRHPVENANYSRSFCRLNELTRDPETTSRLIMHVAERNPGRNGDWCVEKAIYDLERDRMTR